MKHSTDKKKARPVSGPRFESATKNPRGTRWRCERCKGRRLVIVESFPAVRYARCPSCNGTNPHAAQAMPERKAA